MELTGLEHPKGTVFGSIGRLETVGRSLIGAEAESPVTRLVIDPTGLDLSNGRISAPDWRWHPSSREAQSEIARAKKPRLRLSVSAVHLRGVPTTP